MFLVFINCTKTDKTTKTEFYQINATIKGVKENSKVALFNYDEKKVIDTTIIKHGKFYFKGNLEFPFQAAISIDDEWLMIPFWAEKGEISINTDKQTIIKFRGDDSKYFATGKEINPLYQRYNEFMKPSQNIKGEKYQLMKKGIISEKEFQQQIDTIFKLVFQFFNDESNADNYLSLSEMINYREGIPKKDLKIYYNKLSQKLKDSPKGKALYAYFTYNGVKVGEIAPEIIAKNVNGKEISLKDYRGNYVLLDFWASWCMPCIEEIKTTLPILHKKYQSDNFKIISFSSDNDTESWIKKSAELNMAWDNISNNISANINPIAIKYGVKVLPTRFLIDPNGVVIKRFTDEEDLLIEIDKLMK
ncbi:redoxin domain-containing protein [Polaribacter sp.]